jgi:hypothetical protein
MIIATALRHDSGTTNDGGAAGAGKEGIAFGATAHSGFAVQDGKPKDADAVKLLPFPKPGASFGKW